MKWGRRILLTVLCAVVAAGAWAGAAAGVATAAGSAGAAAAGGSAVSAVEAVPVRAATLAKLLDAAGPVTPEPKVLNDLFGPAARASKASSHLPVGLHALGALPGSKETMAFSAGRVAVAVIFLESDGSIMKSTENWTRQDPDWRGEDRRSLVLEKIQSALDWWNAQSPDGSLELFMPETGSYGAPQLVSTGYEPINCSLYYGYRGHRSICSDAAFRWQVMGKLGYRHDARDDKPYPETAYANKVRRANDADWAFVVYVVDSLKDYDGMFNNWVVAYTNDLFGPYTMLTYDNDGYGFQNFDAVLAHEMGHQFGALDEYRPPVSGYPSTGKLKSGYLGVRNSNAVRGGTTNYLCIMRGANEALSAFARDQVCPSTYGQAGFRDTDGDKNPDVTDTRPSLTGGAQESTGDGGVTVGGTITEQPRARGKISMGTYFRHDISIKVPHDVQYRVDHGEWSDAEPADGAFDEVSEGWTVTTPALSAGHHVLQVQGTTGEAATLTQDIWSGATPVTLQLATDTDFSRTTATGTAGKPLRLHVRSGTGGTAIPYLSPITIVRTEDEEPAATLETGSAGVWSGAARPLKSGTYEARYDGSDTFVGPAASGQITLSIHYGIVATMPSGPYHLGGRLSIRGLVKPATPGLTVVLEERYRRSLPWRQVTSCRTGSASAFLIRYRVEHSRVQLRLRCAASGDNLEGLLKLGSVRAN